MSNKTLTTEQELTLMMEAIFIEDQLREEDRQREMSADLDYVKKQEYFSNRQRQHYDSTQF